MQLLQIERKRGQDVLHQVQDQRLPIAGKEGVQAATDAIVVESADLLGGETELLGMVRAWLAADYTFPIESDVYADLRMAA